MKYLVFLFVCVPLFCGMAQEVTQNTSTVDSLYREDQVYIGITFNLLGNRPASVSQNGLSGALQAGFIRDMPINKTRTRAIGVGIGIAADTFNHNLFIGEEADDITTIYKVIPSNINDDANRFSFYSIEMPIEYRWRTSTPTRYSFWRIHGGVKLGYIYSFKSTFEQQGNNVVQTDIPELNPFQYGLSFSFGYGAFNFQAYYGLNTLFDENAKLDRDGENINLRVIRLGLQFYFL